MCRACAFLCQKLRISEHPKIPSEFFGFEKEYLKDKIIENI
jgi:hypothetical protein